MTKQITFLDFFAGIGGFRTAVERLGGKCLGFAEIDKHARQSYKALYNTEGEREWHDITQVTDTEFAELAGKVDLINAGFPCQAFSVAGKRQGFEDSRGTLFYEVARAAKAIRPKYILLENVKGLLSHDKGNTVDVIFRTLNEIGYTIDFTVLNSKHFGVPQNRERIFIMAVRDDLVMQEAWNIEGTGVVAKAKRRFSEYEGIKSFNFFGWSAQHTTVAKRLRDVLEAQVDEKFYLSDEKTAQLIEKVDDKVLVKEATRLGYAEAYPGDAVNMAQPNSKTRRGRVGRALANTLLTGQEQAVIEPVGAFVGIGHHPFSKKQEFSGFHDGVSPCLIATDYKAPKCVLEKALIVENTQVVADLNHYGNEQMNRVYGIEGQSPTVIAVSGGGREPKIAEPQEFTDGAGISYCNTTSYAEGTSAGDVGKGRRTHLIECIEKYRIRKLTPLECWRLQGYSDEQHQKAVDAGVSNSQRYKQAGNSVTVNVIEAIVTQLIALEATQENETTEVA